MLSWAIKNIEKFKTAVSPNKGHNFEEKFTHKADQKIAVNIIEPLDT